MNSYIGSNSQNSDTDSYISALRSLMAGFDEAKDEPSRRASWNRLGIKAAHRASER